MKKKKLEEKLTIANGAYLSLVKELAAEKSMLARANERVESTLRKHQQFCERVAQRISSASSTTEDIYSDLDAFLKAQDDAIVDPRCTEYEELYAEYDSFVEAIASHLECSSREGDEVLKALELFVNNVRKPTWTSSDDGKTLMCDHVNKFGERCFRASRMVPGETEEDAKVRIMAVDMTDTGDEYVREDDEDEGPESE